MAASTSSATQTELNRLRTFPTFSSVCPTANLSKSTLESVSIYQTVDLLCEGQIEGLCDRHGNLIHLTSDSKK